MTIAPARDGALTAGWPDSVLASPGATSHSVTLVTECGRSMAVDVARWHAPAGAADLSVVARCGGPVLDIGSGPGRIVKALQHEGISALGIDVSHVVVEQAIGSGVSCVVADVFGAVPRPGSWEMALLLDGNVGIGGDPVRLLRRVAELTSPSGTVIVEIEPRHRGGLSARRVQVVHGSDLSAWFAWAVVSIDELPVHASESGWTTAETWSCDDRWFSRLVRSGPSA